MTWSSVHQSSSIFHRDIFRSNDATGSIAEWMAIFKTDKRRSDDFCFLADRSRTNNSGHFVEHFCCDDRQCAIHFDERVFMSWMHGNCEICRQSPWSRRPNHERWFAFALDTEGCVHFRCVGGFEVNIDRRIDAIFIFQLRLCKRGPICNRPMHRFQLAKDISLFQ